MAVLALLSGRSPVTESVVTGQALEQYWLSVSYLLGCAACSGSLFAELLETNNCGSLCPLQSAKITHPRSLMSVVQDLAQVSRHEEEQGKKCEEDEECQGEEQKPVNQREKEYLARVTKALASLTYNEDCCYVAALGSPDKFPFADSVLFIDDRLFVCQVKDYADSSKINVQLERWKMGAVDDAALTAFIRTVRNRIKGKSQNAISELSNRQNLTFTKLIGALGKGKPSNTSYEICNALGKLKNMKVKNALLKEVVSTYQDKVNLVGNLASIWFKKTKVQVVSVHRVFVTRTPFTKAPTNTSEQYQFTSTTYDFLAVGNATQGENTINIKMECDLFVSVDQIKFLRFRPKSSRPTMISQIAVPKGDTDNSEDKQIDTAEYEDNQIDKIDKPMINAINSIKRSMKSKKATWQKTMKSKKAKSQMGKHRLQTRRK